MRKEEYEYAPASEAARALRALAAALGLHPVPLLDRLAGHGLCAALALAGEQAGLRDDEVEDRYARCRAALAAPARQV